MAGTVKLSRRTRLNWLVDCAVFGGAIAASLSGIYFLYFISGYEGGRNPLFDVMILFSRHSWEDIHVWGGVVMIAAVVIHLAYHWNWVRMTARRMAGAMRGKGGRFSRGGLVNVVVDSTIALGFLVAALSGVYFLFVPGSGMQGGRNLGWDPGFVFSRTTWDVIHTWSGVVMIAAAVVHFAIHWRWVVNTTRKFFQTLRPSRNSEIQVGAKPTPL